MHNNTRHPGTASFRIILFAVCQNPFITCNNFAKSSLDNILGSISSSTVTIDKCFYASPTPCQRRFQNRFRAFFALIFFLMLVRLVHGDAIFCFMQSTVCEGYRRNTQRWRSTIGGIVPWFCFGVQRGKVWVGNSEDGREHRISGTA